MANAIASATAKTASPIFPKQQPTPRVYAYGSYVDEPLAIVEGSAKTKYYYVSNHLDSVAAITDSTGTMVERYKYDAYGKQTVLGSNGTVSYAPSDYGQFVGYTGRYGDWETGLVYFRNRYYDTGLGRYVSRNNYGERDLKFTVHPAAPLAVRLMYVKDSTPSLTYIDGFGLYTASFASEPGLDPSGQPGYHQCAPTSGLDFGGGGGGGGGGSGGLGAAISGMLGSIFGTSGVTTEGVGIGIGVGAGAIGAYAPGTGYPNYGMAYNNLTGPSWPADASNPFYNYGSSQSMQSSGDSTGDPDLKDLKRLTPGEIRGLKKCGNDPHDMKDNSKQDLYKDKDGNVYAGNKDGTGKGNPTGINIHDK